MNSFATVATFVLFWLQFCRADGKHRLLVADSESGKIRVHDLADGEHVADLEVDGPARVYALSAGRYAFAVQTTSNSSHAIDGGVWIEDHGDHMHPYEQLPVVRPFKVEGATPIHFVEHGDQIAIFNDGTGSGSVMKTSDVAQADPPIHIVESGLAHHGVAVPVGNDVLISVADEGQRLPKGVDRRNRSSVVIQQMHECPLLHGEATSGSKVAFGCGDGVLIVDTSKSPMEAHKVASPDGEEGRVGTVYSHPEVGFFIGNHGPTGLSKIDPEGDTMVVFPVPVAVGAFGFTNDGHAIVAVTVDGHVHRISPTSGNILTSARIIAPYESGTRPALAFAPHKVIVSDHIEGTIHVLNDNDLSEEMTIDGDGIPLSMAVVGYESGDHDHDHDHDHDDDHDHDHDHDDDHDHDHGDGDHNGGKQRVTNKVLIVISSSIALYSYFGL